LCPGNLSVFSIPRILTTTIDGNDGTASLGLVFSVAPYFELKRDEAETVAREVGRADAKWKTEAAKLDIPAEEIARMGSAFEHKDLQDTTSL
jgi:serine/threonine-protein kinase HipA